MRLTLHDQNYKHEETSVDGQRLMMSWLMSDDHEGLNSGSAVLNISLHFETFQLHLKNWSNKKYKNEPNFAVKLV